MTDHQPAYIREHGPMQVPLRIVRLASEIESLMAEPAWQHGDRVARTLTKESVLRAVLTVMRAGAKLEPHTADGAVTIQCVQGRMHLITPAEDGSLSHADELIAGELAVLDRGLAHSVEAVDECAFLLTVAH